MAVIIEANYSKKLGLPEFSSHQYSVTLRTEITDLSQLEQVNAELYARLQTAVDGQIVQPGYVPGKTTNHQPVRSATPSTNEHAWKCSDKQRDLILKMIGEHHLDTANIDSLAVERFGTGLQQLNKVQASGLIGELMETYGKTSTAGRSGRQAYTGRGGR